MSFGPAVGQTVSGYFALRDTPAHRPSQLSPVSVVTDMFVRPCPCAGLFPGAWSCVFKLMKLSSSLLQTMGAHRPCSIEVTAYQPKWSPGIIVLIVVVAVVVVSLIVALAIVMAMRFAPPHCQPGRVSRGRDMEQPGLFNDLSPAEMRAVRDFLLGEEKLGLTPLEEASLNSSYIYMIDLQVSGTRVHS